MNVTKLIYTIPAFILSTNLAQAQTCSPVPSCAELGYTKTIANCSGKSLIKCPFDQSKVFCEDYPSCDSLGFTDTVNTCNGEYTKCPTNSAKGKCINGPQVGDIKYSLKSINHNGWLLCDGSQYNQTTYSKLYGVIYSNFCSVRSGGCSSGKFAVPDYRGFFLRGSAYPSSSTLTYQGYSGSWNYSTTTPQKQQLPDIFGNAGYYSSGGFFHTYGRYSGAFKLGSASSWRLSGDGNTSGYDLGFQASNSNSIYSGSHVIPANYGTYIFIYAGQ